MMALFIVLWLLNSSKKIQDAVGGYFRDPHGTADKAGKDIVGSAGGSIVPHDNMEQLKQQLEKAISGVPNFDKLKSHIEMTVTPEGLRIELLESANGDVLRKRQLQTRAPTGRTSSSLSPSNWESCRTSSPWKATPTPSPTPP